MFDSVYQVETLNKSNGYHFFDADSKRFFSSRILSGIYRGVYFITSERNGFDDYSRSFTIRMACKNGSIETIGGFNRFPTKYQAQKYIKGLPELLPDFIEAAKKYWNTKEKTEFPELAKKHPETLAQIRELAKELDLEVLFNYPIKELNEVIK